MSIITLDPKNREAARAQAAALVQKNQPAKTRTGGNISYRGNPLDTTGGTQTSSAGALSGSAGNGISNYSLSSNAGGVSQYGRRQNRYDSNGGVGVRQALNNAGIDNSRIGYQNGKVTVDGLEFTPASIADGVSYANESDVNNFVNDIYRNQGDELVRIADYVSGTGLSIQPTYDNGKVYLGGQEVPYAYIENGRAYVRKSVLDNIYKNLAARAGVQPADAAYQYWKNQYQNRLEDKLSDIENSRFEYNLEQDPAYQAYKDMYTREGERAYRAAAAQMAAQNGGNMTSMAQSAANQQLNYYMQQLGDRIPELQQNAYNRFAEDRDMRLQAYDRYVNQADSDYNRMQYANELARQQYLDGYNELKGRDAEQLDMETKRLNNESLGYQNSAQDLENRGLATEVAQTQGGYTDETRDAAGVPEDRDAYAGMDIIMDKELEQYRDKLGWENFYTLQQMEAEFGYNVDLRKLDFMNEKELEQFKASLENINQLTYLEKQAQTDEEKAQKDHERQKEIEELIAWFDRVAIEKKAELENDNTDIPSKSLMD